MGYGMHTSLVIVISSVVSEICDSFPYICILQGYFTDTLGKTHDCRRYQLSEADGYEKDGI